MKILSSALFWLFVFTAMITLETVSAFAQTANINGTWTNGSGGVIQYPIRTPRTTKPGRDSHFSYKFNVDGTYEFVGYMETMMYNCTTSLFNQITGNYGVGDRTIQLDPTRDLWKSTHSCAASGNKRQTKPTSKKSVNFDIREDSYGATLLCITEGKGETCYRKEKQLAKDPTRATSIDDRRSDNITNAVMRNEH